MRDDNNPWELGPSQEAVEREDWIEAIFTRLEAMAGFAVEVLGAAGVWSRLPAKWAEDPWGALADTALSWGRQRPTPDPFKPLPLEDAAALFLCRFAEFQDLSEQFIADVEADEIDFNEVCRLQYLAAEMGVFGEVFRGSWAGFAHDPDDLTARVSAQLVGALNGGQAMKDKADAWRKPALGSAKSLRMQHPKWGDGRISDHLVERGLLHTRQREAFMRWARKNGLPPSAVNPTLKPGMQKP
jgi:hypothetical protein